MFERGWEPTVSIDYPTQPQALCLAAAGQVHPEVFVVDELEHGGADDLLLTGGPVTDDVAVPAAVAELGDEDLPLGQVHFADDVEGLALERGVELGVLGLAQLGRAAPTR